MTRPATRGWIARVGAVVLGAVLAVAGTPTGALAHGDTKLADETIDLGPGETVSYTAGLHYHRVVATITAEAPVAVEIVRESTGAVVATADPGSTIEVNQLVRCCPDSAWVDHTLIVRNVGTDRTTADVRARLVHDDLAVMVDGAESGTRVSIVVLGLAWMALLWRSVRRRPNDVPLGLSVRRLTVVAVGVLALAAWGTWRYGVGGAPAVVAGLADVPVLPFNPVVSRATLLIGVAMVAWGRAGTAWARTDDTATASWWATGASLVGAAVVVAVLVADAYGRAGAATGAAVAAAVPLLAVPLLRQAGRSAGEHPQVSVQE